MTCGVYRLTFPSGKFYIGSSCRVERRVQRHRCDLRNKEGVNPILQNAFNKHGLFDAEVIIICRKEDLEAYEQLCIDGLNPELNSSKRASWRELTPKQRAAMRERLHPDEAKRRMSVSHTGKKMSTEAIARRVEARRLTMLKKRIDTDRVHP